MKYICLLFLCIFCYCVKAQKVSFRLYTTDACSGVEKIDGFCILRKSSATLGDTSYVDRSGTIVLPDIGSYLVYPHGSLLYSLSINIKSAGLYTMHFKDSLIMSYSSATDEGPFYVSCDQKRIEGYKEDYYSNGQIKIRGTFKNGHVKDSLIKFHPNGNLKQKMLYLKHEVFNTYYDSLGNKYWEYYRFQTKKQTSFHATLTRYFPSEKIQFKEYRNSYYLNTERYYPNGNLMYKQTKNKREEYTENGKLMTLYSLKHKKDKNTGDYAISVNKKQYDTQGNITDELAYELWTTNKNWTFTKQTKPDWITVHKINKNGTLKNKESDMDPKVYLTKYSWDTEDDGMRIY
jgi:antitoxin component YwqK of YwqJK toxin-antitoxin module